MISILLGPMCVGHTHNSMLTLFHWLTKQNTLRPHKPVNTRDIFYHVYLKDIQYVYQTSRMHSGDQKESQKSSSKKTTPKGLLCWFNMQKCGN